MKAEPCKTPIPSVSNAPINRHKVFLVGQGILHSSFLPILLQQIVERLNCQRVQGGVMFSSQHAQGSPARGIHPGHDSLKGTRVPCSFSTFRLVDHVFPPHPEIESM